MIYVNELVQITSPGMSLFFFFGDILLNADAYYLFLYTLILFELY